MDNYSILFRNNIVTVLLGLGLPVPALHRKELWGYERNYEQHIYYPKLKELQAFSIALEMDYSRDYSVDDILAWLNEASGCPMSKRTYFLLKKDRPLYPEYKLSLEDRINIFNGLTPPPSSKKSLEKTSKREAYYKGRSSEVTEGNGQAEKETA